MGHNVSPWIHLPDSKIHSHLVSLPSLGFYQHCSIRVHSIYLCFFPGLLSLTVHIFLSLLFCALWHSSVNQLLLQDSNKGPLATKKQWQEQTVVCVTGSADQSTIELFLNVCQFKNRAQRYIWGMKERGRCDSKTVFFIAVQSWPCI